MNVQPITMVRVYTTEGQSKLEAIMHLLHDEEKVSGVTVLRGISGFGDSGKIHASNLLDLSFDLPLIVEFFDAPERAIKVIERLESELSLTHIVRWAADLQSH